jgi:hypothetical protein
MHASVGEAVLRTLAYSDIFDFPQKLSELHRYLVEVRISREELAAWLDRAIRDGLPVERRGVYYFLDGRESTVDTRTRRLGISSQLWPLAHRYSRMVGRIPFVRMVGVTGGLSVDNVENRDDIDLFVVTEPGKLWLCRALIVGLVRAVNATGISLCPNFLISMSSLELSERDLFTARELMQMVPMVGGGTYQRLRSLNPWADELLPNAFGPPEKSPVGIPTEHRASRLGERLLSNRAGCRLERWEMDRKVRRFSRQADPGNETGFDAEWCKGHFGNHRRRTFEAYRKKLDELGLAMVGSEPAAVEFRLPGPDDRMESSIPLASGAPE